MVVCFDARRVGDRQVIRTNQLRLSWGKSRRHAALFSKFFRHECDKRNIWLRRVAQDSETTEIVSPESRTTALSPSPPAFSQPTRNIQLCLNGEGRFAKNSGNGLRKNGGKGRVCYRMGFRNRGIRPPSTMKMENAASMTPEMAGTCTASAFSAGLSQYMERMTLK